MNARNAEKEKEVDIYILENPAEVFMNVGRSMRETGEVKREKRNLI